jgi:hypothetical protein
MKKDPYNGINRLIAAMGAGRESMVGLNCRQSDQIDRPMEL